MQTNLAIGKQKANFDDKKSIYLWFFSVSGQFGKKKNNILNISPT
jgi:hypothetical protein